jgi:hypothetical protein
MTDLEEYQAGKEDSIEASELLLYGIAVLFLIAIGYGMA